MKINESRIFTTCTGDSKEQHKIQLEDNEYCLIKTTTGDMIMTDILEIDIYIFHKENEE